MNDDKNTLLKNISDNTDTITDKLDTLKTSKLRDELSVPEKTSVDLKCLVCLLLKYAEYNMCSPGYRSFHVIVREIHGYKRSLNIRENGYNDCITAMYHYTSAMATRQES